MEILFVYDSEQDYNDPDYKVHLLVREVDNLTWNVAQCGKCVDRDGGYEQPLLPIIDYFGGEYPIPEEHLCLECFGLNKPTNRR